MDTRYVQLSREEWAHLREATPLTLSEEDVDRLRGLNDPVSVKEVVEIYLPLSRLLNLRVAATQGLHASTTKFLGTTESQPPYIIGIAGSVAVGKSTTARLLQALLASWPDHPQVDLVTTDGFLMPNRVLEERGLMKRKGFPESYDVRRLVQFVADVKGGAPDVRAPVYSHTRYDIIDGQWQIVRQPHILILEGLNVLQTGSARPGIPLRTFVSDFFDFSVYVDAEEADIESWYVERFLTLRETVFRDPDLVLPSLRRVVGRGGTQDRARHLGVDQSDQPAREHPADARASPSRARQGAEPRRPEHPVAPVVTRRARSSRRRKVVR